MIHYIGIRSDILDNNFAMQRNSMWCWAASIQMVLRYYGVTISQEAIVKQSFGVDEWGNPANKPAGFDIMTKHLNKWGVDVHGQHFEIRAMLSPGAPSPSVLLRELSSHRPILISYNSRPRMNHAVVCTAAKITEENGRQVIKSIVVRDPAPYKKNIEHHGRIEHRALTLAQKTAAYWLIRVKKIS